MTLSPDRLLEISKNIQISRLKQRKSAEEVATEIGITVSHYWQIEEGYKAPSLETLINIANILQVSLDVLVYGEPDKRYKNIIHMIRPLSEEQVDKLECVIRVILNTLLIENESKREPD